MEFFILPIISSTKWRNHGIKLRHVSIKLCLAVAMEMWGVHLVAVPQGAKQRPSMIGLTDLITGWVLNGSSWQRQHI